MTKRPLPPRLRSSPNWQKSDPSALVRLYLAAALQRTPIDQRWNIAKNLLAHTEDKDDHNLPLMIWYGIEPLVAAEPTRAVKLMTTSKIPTLRKYISRRITERIPISCPSIPGARRIP